MSYIEVAKECPECHKKTLFFCVIIIKLPDFEGVEAKLGVRCRNCNYETVLKEEETD